jgi:hypothetical protein
VTENENINEESSTQDCPAETVTVSNGALTPAIERLSHFRREMEITAKGKTCGQILILGKNLNG